MGNIHNQLMSMELWLLENVLWLSIFFQSTSKYVLGDSYVAGTRKNKMIKTDPVSEALMIQLGRPSQSWVLSIPPSKYGDAYFY